MKIARVLASAYVLGIVGAAAWAFTDPRGFWGTAGKARKKIERETGARLPRPEIMLVGPSDEESFEALDYFLCEAAVETVSRHPELAENADPKELVDAVTTTTLAKLYPDFPWPAVSGDHASATELQGLVRYEVQRGLAQNTLCLTQDQLDDMNDDYDDGGEPSADFIPPPPYAG